MILDQAPQHQMNPPAPQVNQEAPMMNHNNADMLMQEDDDHLHQEVYLENDDQMMMDNQMIDEERMRSEENIYNTHLDAVKEEVQLIQKEGEMITTLERAIKNEEEYDMSDYLYNAR